MPRQRIQIVGLPFLLALSLTSAWAQKPAPSASRRTPASPTDISVVTSIRLVEEHGVPAVEILSTLPSVPSIQFLNSPPRLVIDLLHARMGIKEKPSDPLEGNILAVRAEQFQANPPVARVVLDLRAALGYTWDEAGNRLMVRLKPAEEVSADGKKTRLRPATKLSLAPAAAPNPAPADVVLEESSIAAGSTVTSGGQTAVLRLTRGGEVRICPGASVSVTPSKTTKDLMLGMNTGALETHYELGASADTVMTPDFRILFAGPGEFDFAISANSHGDTCVRGLAGNGSSAIVSELMGSRVYQVKPGEQAVFRAGQIDRVDSRVPSECGCPPAIPVLRADAPVGTESGPAPDSKSAVRDSAKSVSRAGNSAEGNLAGGNERSQTLSNGPETRPLPPSEPNAIHIEVEAPFVFHGKKGSGAAPAPVDEAAALPVMQVRAQPQPAELQIQPPAAPQPAQGQSPIQSDRPPHRLLRRIKGFFAAIFR